MANTIEHPPSENRILLIDLGVIEQTGEGLIFGARDHETTNGLIGGGLNKGVHGVPGEFYLSTLIVLKDTNPQRDKDNKRIVIVNRWRSSNPSPLDLIQLTVPRACRQLPPEA